MSQEESEQNEVGGMKILWKDRSAALSSTAAASSARRE